MNDEVQFDERERRVESAALRCARHSSYSFDVWCRDIFTVIDREDCEAILDCAQRLGKPVCGALAVMLDRMNTAPISLRLVIP